MFFRLASSCVSVSTLLRAAGFVFVFFLAIILFALSVNPGSMSEFMSGSVRAASIQGHSDVPVGDRTSPEGPPRIPPRWRGKWRDSVYWPPLPAESRQSSGILGSLELDWRPEIANTIDAGSAEKLPRWLRGHYPLFFCASLTSADKGPTRRRFRASRRPSLRGNLARAR